jgi:hypothetical protein
MSDRPVIQVLTIEQWDALDPGTKVLILKNIRLKDRLIAYLEGLNYREKEKLTQAAWKACKHCEQRGWVLHEPRHPGIHPSEIGYGCTLRIYKMMIGEEKDQHIDWRSRLIFDMGHAVHHMLQSYGEDGAWGPWYRKEVPIEPDLYPVAKEFLIYGHADGESVLRIDDIPDHPYIYEVGLIQEYKTEKTENFSKRTKVKPEHQQQATSYCVVLNRPITVVLYFNKNTQELLDFPVPLDLKVWGGLRSMFSTLKTHYDNRGSMPPPIGSPGFGCNQCPYSKRCEDYHRYLGNLGQLKKAK